jgi:hypothetical protein
MRASGAALTVGLVVAALRWVGAGPQTPDLIERWTDAVRAHALGTADREARELAAWPDAWLTTLHAQIRRALDRVRAKPEDVFFDQNVRRLGARNLDELNRLVKRAAQLHADIAMFVPGPPPGTRRPVRDALGGSGVIVRDGETIGVQGNPAHWTFGRMLLDGLHVDLGADLFVRHWYRATAAYQLHRFDLSSAEPHLRHATAVVAADAVLWLYKGMTHDLLAAPPVQTAVAKAAVPDGFRLAVRPPDRELGDAQAAFATAVALDPTLVEAHVRLGRILGLSSDSRGAVDHLRIALELGPDRRLSYFASLELGRQEHLRGNAAAAREALGRAAALYPRAQSPHLALAQLAAVEGDPVRAAAQTRDALAVGRDARDGDDPWWRYYWPTAADFAARFAAMVDAAKHLDR